MTTAHQAYTESWAKEAPAPSAETINKALRLTAFDYTDHLWWREDATGDLRLFIQCDDLFAWGCSDVEMITDANIDSLVATVAECEAILEPIYREKTGGKVGGRYRADDAFLLWVARQRHMRPQGAFYRHFEEVLRPLFDACGPVRPVNLLNPKPQP